VTCVVGAGADTAAHPNPKAPRCLPCDYQDPLQGQVPHGSFDAPMVGFKRPAAVPKLGNDCFWLNGLSITRLLLLKGLSPGLYIIYRPSCLSCCKSGFHCPCLFICFPLVLTFRSFVALCMSPSVFSYILTQDFSMASPT